MKQALFCAIVCCAVSFAADDATRPDFTGSWHLDLTKSETHTKNEATKWDIQQTTDTITISEQSQGKTESLKCETNGKECKGKQEGEAADISFYFNGPMLVEMDMIGHSRDHVVKKRLRLAADGKTMEVEVLHINPQAPSEKWVFAKQ